MLKVGDRVRFRPEIPWPSDWGRKTWTVTQLSTRWVPSVGVSLALAWLRARDGKIMEAVDVRVLMRARRDILTWLRRR
jgi:hypothetical protein